MILHHQFLQQNQLHHRTNVQNHLLPRCLNQIALENAQIFPQFFAPDPCLLQDAASIITDPELIAKLQSLLQLQSPLHLQLHLWKLYLLMNQAMRHQHPNLHKVNARWTSQPNPEELQNQLRKCYQPQTWSIPMWLFLESETEKQPRQRSTKSTAKQSAIPVSIPTDTIMLKARVLVAMASDEAISLQDFDNYLKGTNLKFFNPALCTDEKPYKCICMFGPPNIGKSEAASSLNSYMNGVRQTTSSKKFYKWTCKRNNTNLFHYTNDGFSSDGGINWNNLIQSFDSVISNSPGRHMIVIEGHRLFESEEVMAKSDYTVILTGTPHTLRSRKRPTSQESLDLYSSRIKPWVKELNASRQILKIDARSSALAMSKKIAAYVIMREEGLPNAGRTLSDTTNLLELKDDTWEWHYNSQMAPQGKDPFRLMDIQWLALVNFRY